MTVPGEVLPVRDVALALCWECRYTPTPDGEGGVLDPPGGWTEEPGDDGMPVMVPHLAICPMRPYGSQPVPSGMPWADPQHDVKGDLRRAGDPDAPPCGCPTCKARPV